MKILFIYSLFFLSPLALSAKNMPQLQISAARVYLPLPGSTITSGYATFKNKGKNPLTVKLQKADDFQNAELHETSSKDGMMRMQEIHELVIPAHGTVVLKPGSYHMMLYTPQKSFKSGDKTKITFTVNGAEQSMEFQLAARAEK